MQEIIAGLDQFTFTFEKDVERQKGTGLLPFQGMDKSGSAVCNFFAKGVCEKGKLCPLRHSRGEKMVVCKHWLRGLCKRGDQCNFLHQYDVTRMPECYFYSKFGDCNNKECPFLHLKPAFKTWDCPWYDQGFCKDGPLCKHRHVRKIMCANYFVGFCPEGPKCRFAHCPPSHAICSKYPPVPGEAAAQTPSHLRNLCFRGKAGQGTEGALCCVQVGSRLEGGKPLQSLFAIHKPMARFWPLKP
ncbi:putative cleavage and polyadenylation specificity factor subunit 4-like protein [Crocuta crocuta]